MKSFKGLLSSRLLRIIQGNHSRNRAALQCLLTLGYPADRARKSILDLNNVKIPALANGVSVAVLYQTRNGENKTNTEAKRILASSVGLEVEELFPETE